MPNWCDNYVRIIGPTSEMEKLYEAATSSEEGTGLCSHVLPLEEKTGVLGASYAWGTKWDINEAEGEIYEYEDDNSIVELSFMSAWSPPTGVYEALVNAGYDVFAGYYEPGMEMCGVFDDGEDREYEMSSDNRAFFETDDDGMALDEMFGIIDTIDMMEDEWDGVI